MSQRFEDQAMEDLAVEAPAASADEAAADLGADLGAEDGLEDLGEGEGFEGGEGFDEALDEGDAFEGEDLGDEFASGDAAEGEGVDDLEAEVADALEAENTDELLRRFRNIANIARRVGRGVGQVARVVAPLASAIPIPQAQALGRVAGVLGRVLADGGDELEAFDEIVDLAESEGSVDAFAPFLAGLAVHRTLPRMGRMPRALRLQLVRMLRRAIQLLTRRGGVRTARVAPRLVLAARRNLAQRRQPARALPQAIARTAQRVAARPQVLRRLTLSRVSPYQRRRRGGGQRLDDGFEGFTDAEGAAATDEFEGADEGFDGADEFGEADLFDEADGADDLEAEVADALEAENTDELLRRFRNIANIARRVGRGVGQVARVVAPLASAIPIPQAQALGRVAGVLGRVLADGGDELEAFDEIAELSEDELDAAAPLVAGVALRASMPAVRRAAPAVRRQLVRAATHATRTALRQGGGAGVARVVPRVVQGVRRAVVQRRLPPRAAPAAIRQVVQRVVASPRVVRRIAAAPVAAPAAQAVPVRVAVPGAPAVPVPVPVPAPVAAATGPRRFGSRLMISGGGRVRQFTLPGPVHLTIRSN